MWHWRSNDMKYKIGDVERIIGIAPETIRFFEKRGIVKPKKNEKNNYRLFNAMDIHKLVAYKYYRNMDFTTDEAIDFLDNYNFREASARLSEQIVAIENKIKHYQELSVRIKEVKESFNNIERLVDNYVLEEGPELIFFNNQVNHQFKKGEVETKKKVTRKWLEHMPFIWLALNILEADIPDGTQVFWGYAISTKYQEKINQLDLNYSKRIEAKLCVHTIIKCSNDEILQPYRLKPALNYIREQGLQLNGEVVGWIINEEHDKNQLARYFELWIPVKKIK